jgi:protein gp37
MADGSKIEWTDATWNVVIGCDKVSPGCDHCYAIRTAHRMQANPNPKIAAAYAGTEADGEWTGQVNLVEDRLELPLSWTRPRRIFVNAQSDLFHKDVPDEFIARVWAVMALAPQHTFQILTKRHGRMRSLLNSEHFKDMVAVEMAGQLNPHPREALDLHWPRRNVWLGVSVEDQQRAGMRIDALRETPAAVRWLSCEPLLGPVCLDAFHSPDGHHPGALAACEAWPSGIDWVVVGGESGPGARPMHPDWARTLRDQCVAAGIPFLFKQWGEWSPEQGGRGQDVLIDLDGNGIAWSKFAQSSTAAQMWRTGKRAAGRELDGRTWDEYPQEVSRV